MVLHLVYGIVTSGLFAVGVLSSGLSHGSIGVATELGLFYDIILMIIGMVFWMRMMIGLEPDRDMIITFGTVHVIYGLDLRAFLGAGILA